MSDDLQALAAELRTFTAARDWQAFHAPKNLAIALSVEASELLEHFQWMPEQDSRHLNLVQRDAVALEMADVLLYLLMLSDQLGIDPVEAAWRKLRINEARYPIDKARGVSTKYSEL